MTRIFTRLALMNALIWAVTILACAVAAKATDEFLYVLLVLAVGSLSSGAAITTAGRAARGHWTGPAESASTTR